MEIKLGNRGGGEGGVFLHARSGLIAIIIKKIKTCKIFLTSFVKINKIITSESFTQNKSSGLSAQ